MSFHIGGGIVVTNVSAAAGVITLSFVEVVVTGTARVSPYDLQPNDVVSVMVGANLPIADDPLPE